MKCMCCKGNGLIVVTSYLDVNFNLNHISESEQLKSDCPKCNGTGQDKSIRSKP